MEGIVRSTEPTHTLAFAVVALTLASTAMAAPGSVALRPIAGDTLIDGCLFGPADGLADSSDNTDTAPFYAGSITRETQATDHPIEHRVVYRYDLASAAGSDPGQATLRIFLRGGTVYDRPDAEVDVVAFASSASRYTVLNDFHADAVFQDRLLVPALQVPTAYDVDVRGAVSDALASGAQAVTFRLQMRTDSTEDRSQAFVYAPSNDVAWSPTLTISTFAPSDCDQDGDVDLADYEGLAGCLHGPGEGIATDCDCFDLNHSGDVDLADYLLFQRYFADQTP